MFGDNFFNVIEEVSPIRFNKRKIRRVAEKAVDLTLSGPDGILYDAIDKMCGEDKEDRK